MAKASSTGLGLFRFHWRSRRRGLGRGSLGRDFARAGFPFGGSLRNAAAIALALRVVANGHAEAVEIALEGGEIDLVALLDVLDEGRELHLDLRLLDLEAAALIVASLKRWRSTRRVLASSSTAPATPARSSMTSATWASPSETCRAGAPDCRRSPRFPRACLGALFVAQNILPPAGDEVGEFADAGFHGLALMMERRMPLALGGDLDAQIVQFAESSASWERSTSRSLAASERRAWSASICSSAPAISLSSPRRGPRLHYAGRRSWRARLPGSAASSRRRSPRARSWPIARA
jgi:hypothetical protein